MSVVKKILMAASQVVYTPQEVFSAKTYSGGSPQSINNGINLATFGGLTWIKARNTTAQHALWDTGLGEGGYLTTSGNSSNNPDKYSPLVADTNNSFTSFNSDGFSLGADPSTGIVNASGSNYISWTFRQAERFFQRATVSHTSGVANTVDLSSLGTVGMVIVKRTNGSNDANGDWFLWHRTFSPSTIATLDGAWFNSTNISVAGTTLTIGTGLATGTYAIYAWAHDESPDGCVYCGVFITDLDSVTDVALPWEPQFVMMRPFTNGGQPVAGNFWISDTARGWDQTATDPSILATIASAEITSNDRGSPSANGFQVNFGGGSSSSGIAYLAIRKAIP